MEKIPAAKMRRRSIGRRSFPGRLTLEQWYAAGRAERLDLISRAQADLLGSFRFCTVKQCRRARSCRSVDPRQCHQRLRRLYKAIPKPLWWEWARTHDLQFVYPPQPGESNPALAARLMPWPGRGR